MTDINFSYKDLYDKLNDIKLSLTEFEVRAQERHKKYDDDIQRSLTHAHTAKVEVMTVRETTSILQNSVTTILSDIKAIQDKLELREQDKNKKISGFFQNALQNVFNLVIAAALFYFWNMIYNNPVSTPVNQAQQQIDLYDPKNR